MRALSPKLIPAVLLAASALALGGCATANDAPASSQAPLATGAIRNAEGIQIGSARLTGTASAMALTVEVSGLQPGTYGTHIHTVGRCDAPGFTTAGGHWNPTSRQHGRLNPAGSHHGDLPNLVVGADGRGNFTAPVTGALTGEGGVFDADGAAVVVHAGPDDEHTDPTGNSGGRIACAVLQRG